MQRQGRDGEQPKMSVVLVADDEPAVLDALSGVVEDLGHEVLQARDGREALELIRRRRPHLVITDHMMPHVSGIELCAQLKADPQLRNIPVILLSGATDHGTPDADAFIAKPFELADFEGLIGRMLVAQGNTAAPPLEPLPREEMGALLGWVAHELRTPLSAARIQLHLMEKGLGRAELEPPKKAVRGLKRQVASLEQIAGVVADAGELLTGPLVVSRVPAGIGALVQKLVDSWRDRSPELEFAYTAPAEEVTVSLDVNRITRALETLVGNAVKHGARARKVELAVEAADKHVAVRVTDHGKGIAPEALPTLFSGFRPSEGAGRGLELYVASEIARAHGGGITVRSQPGAGATFTLSIPRA